MKRGAYTKQPMAVNLGENPRRNDDTGVVDVALDPSNPNNTIFGSYLPE
jgi:hypothetical protein